MLQVRLTWNEPSTGVQQQQIAPLPITLGRVPGNTIVLNSDQISRQHTRLELEGNRVILVDLNSSNGTFINQQRITRALLQDGGHFQVGPFLFNVEIVTPSAPAPQANVWLLRWMVENIPQEAVVDRPMTVGREPSNTIVVSGHNISRQHVRIEPAGNQLLLIDTSSNGTFLNGTPLPRSQPTPIKPGDQIGIGAFTFTVALAQPRVSGEATVVESTFATVVEPASQASLIFDDSGGLQFARQPAVNSPTFPPPFFQQDVVPVSALRSSGLPLDETTYLAVGGGLGSFIWVDHLLIFGVDPRQIVSIGLDSKPHGRYERLCTNSQIPRHERLRSNSDSCPDNIWGWPGYAVREIWGSLKRFQLLNAITLAWQIFGEPTFAQTYTPRVDNVFTSIDKEVARIGWPHIWCHGRVKAIRKTDDGRYVVAYTQLSQQTGRRHAFTLADYVHLAVGYPGVRFLKDLQQYRERTNDFQHVVNAYEEHEHVYTHLVQRGGTVLVRGRGIVSSRIIQRLYEMRQQNPQINILHLMRTTLSSGSRYRSSQRVVEHHWEFQPFNWPKAAWSGDLRMVFEKADPNQRDLLLNDWGGTTTADRKDWRQIINRGLREGWYEIRFGNVSGVEQQNGRLVTVIRLKGTFEEEAHLVADFIIDGTGLESELDNNPLLKDLVEHHRLSRNAKGRLQVGNDFEIVGMRNGNARMYASGVMTLGGPYAPVDSFLGLQYTALRSIDALVEARAAGLRRLNGFRSFLQWVRWARGVKP